MSIAAAIFSDDSLAMALGVPVFYGFVEAVVVSLYCVWAWKNGWTKAPTDITLWKALTTSYEVVALEDGGQKNIQLAEGKQQKGEAGWDYVDLDQAKKDEEAAATATTTEPAKEGEEPKKEGGWLSGIMS